VLSINDIHDLFKPLFLPDNKNEKLIHDIYAMFLQIKKNSMENVTGILEEMTALIDETTMNSHENMTQEVQMLLTVLMLSAQAQACKRTAESIIDNYFKSNS
jgi:hypothetical protein